MAPAKSPSSGAHAWRYCMNLALKDLRHDAKTTLVLVLAVASILAPLLLLLGLKTGVIAALRQQLLNDPRNLEIVIYGNARLHRTFFQEAQGRPEVGFAVPKTRTINATLDLVNEKRGIVSGVEIVPTGAGDPLVPPELPLPSRADQVLVSHTLATRLNLRSGDTATGIVRRALHGRQETAKIALHVLGTIPETAFTRDAIFATPELLIAAEDYRDGYRVALLGADSGKGIPPPRETFANGRIYANQLDGVAAIARWIRETGVEVRTQADRIEDVQATDRVLSFVFSVVALIASLGCALALGGALWVNVDRKRRDLALLRLFGFGYESVVLVPLVQSLVIATLAFGVAYLAYLAGATTFNEILGANLSERGYVCQLRGIDTLAAALVTVLVALLAASAGGYRAHKIDPAESLREV